MCFREDSSCYSHYKPLVDNDAPWAWPIWAPGAWLAGFIKRITKHCYTQNIKALDLKVTEKKIFLRFSYCKSRGANDPRGKANLEPKGMIGRIYIGYRLDCYILNIQALGIVVSEKIFMFSYYKPMVDNDAPGARPIWTPGAW